MGDIHPHSFYYFLIFPAFDVSNVKKKKYSNDNIYLGN